MPDGFDLRPGPPLAHQRNLVSAEHKNRVQPRYHYVLQTLAGPPMTAEIEIPEDETRAEAREAAQKCERERSTLEDRDDRIECPLPQKHAERPQWVDAPKKRMGARQGIPGRMQRINDGDLDPKLAEVPLDRMRIGLALD